MTDFPLNSPKTPAGNMGVPASKYVGLPDKR